MRFKRRSGFSKKPREPLFWDRSLVEGADNAGGFGTVTSVTVFDPTTVISGNQDLRLTLRRIRFNFAFRIQQTAAGTTPSLILAASLYVKRTGENTPNPLYGAATDQRADIFFHTSVVQSQPAGAVIAAFFNAVVNNTHNGADPYDAKVGRKMDQDETLVLAVNARQVDAADDTAPTWTHQRITVLSSVLYQRTLRR